MSQNEQLKELFRELTNLVPISDSQYELSFSDPVSEKQIAINLRSKTKIRFWIEASINLEKENFSSSFALKYLGKSDARVHLAANRLVGPYRDREGAEAFYVATNDIADLKKVITLYFSENSEANRSEKNNYKNELNDDELSYPEGAANYRLHRAIERNQTLVCKVKNLRMEKVGFLSCDVCSFDYSKVYGSVGDGYIEAHHRILVSSMVENQVTSIDDMDLVCANCHRMLHRGSQLLTVSELRKLLISSDKT